MSAHALEEDRALRNLLATRGMVLVVGLSFILAERGLTPPYLFAELVEAAPLLWNIIFMAAGAATVVFGLTLSHRSGVLSVLLLTLAITSRALGLVFLTDSIPWAPVSLYAGFLAVVLWAWPRVTLEADLARRLGL